MTPWQVISNKSTRDTLTPWQVISNKSTRDTLAHALKTHPTASIHQLVMFSNLLGGNYWGGDVIGHY